MSEEQIKYLNSIGITTAILIDRIESIISFFTKYLEHQIDDIFISEYRDNDNNWHYISLWLYNKNFCYEAKRFLQEADFESDVILNSVLSFNIKTSNFDFASNIYTELSRMVLNVNFKNSPRVCSLHASKENCVQLSKIFKKYYLTNFMSAIK